MRRISLAVASLLSACELVLPIHEAADAGDDAFVAPDVSDDVGPPDADAGDADANDLVAPGFDGVGGGCGFPWNPSLLSVTLSRPDAGVCRVCVVKSGSGVVQTVKYVDASVGKITLLYGGFAAAVAPEATTSVLFQLDVHLRDGGRNFWPQPQIAAKVSQTGQRVDLNADNGTNAVESIGFGVFDQDTIPDGGTVCFDLVAPYLDAIVQ